jgi:hypothetical protein
MTVVIHPTVTALRSRILWPHRCNPPRTENGSFRLNRFNQQVCILRANRRDRCFAYQALRAGLSEKRRFRVPSTTAITNPLNHQN